MRDTVRALDRGTDDRFRPIVVHDKVDGGIVHVMRRSVLCLWAGCRLRQR
jgi:hypothetical protein